MRKERFQSMVVEIYGNMNNVLVDEEYRTEPVRITEAGEELDEMFFMAELIALKLQFEKLTGDSGMDLFDFVALLTKLVHQYLTSDLS